MNIYLTEANSCRLLVSPRTVMSRFIWMVSGETFLIAVSVTISLFST